MTKSNRHAEHSTPHSSILPAWLAIGVLTIAVWGVYGRSLSSPFIFDDDFSIVGNESITKLLPLWGDGEQLGPLSRFRGSPVAARPLVNLSLAVNYHFGRLDPRGYHLFNVAVHLLNALLLWAIVRQTLRLPCFGDRFDHMAGLLALSVALLWAVHPLATEAVVYVTQRTELMVSLFYLTTIYASLRYWDAATSVARITWLFLATLACLAGAASKEVMVSAPVVVLLFERTFKRSSLCDVMRMSWPLYLGLAASWTLTIALQFGAPHSDSAGFSTGLPAHVWWFTQAKVLLIYLKLAVWPWPLSIHYDPPYLTTIRQAWPYVVPVALLAIAVLFLLWQRFAVGFLGAYVLAILAPTLIVPIPTEIAAERRMYLPLAALVALVVVGGYNAWQQVANRTLSKSDSIRSPIVKYAAMVMLVAIAAGLASNSRLAAFDDPTVLWRDTLARQPNNVVALNNLGHVLLASGQTEQALEHFERAIVLEPEYIDAHFNRANVLAGSDRLDEAAAEYERVVHWKPEFPEAWANLAAVYGRLGDSAKAVAAAEMGLRVAQSKGASLAAGRIEAWLNDYRTWLAKEAEKPAE